MRSDESAGVDGAAEGGGFGGGGGFRSAALGGRDGRAAGGGVRGDGPGADRAVAPAGFGGDVRGVQAAAVPFADVRGGRFGLFGRAGRGDGFPGGGGAVGEPTRVIPRGGHE